jgi:hypothetical protein
VLSTQSELVVPKFVTPFKFINESCQESKKKIILAENSLGGFTSQSETGFGD